MKTTWIAIGASAGLLALGVIVYLVVQHFARGEQIAAWRAQIEQEQGRTRELTRRVELNRGEAVRRIEQVLEERNRLKDELGRLRDRYARSEREASTAPPALVGDQPAAAEGMPRPLGRAEIQAGMRNRRQAVKACFERYKVSGLANVRLTIRPTGTPEEVKTMGMFQGTPTAACVERAVRAARFPRFAGAPITITYPFILR